MKRSLLLGCGFRRERVVYPPGTEHEGWGQLITLDINPDCKPDIVFDLYDGRGPNNQNYRDLFEPDTFDEIHAYEVLEHIGDQGNAQMFLNQFEWFWTWLKPGGIFCATVPKWNSIWAWGDPSHRRVITPGTLVFLSQLEYQRQVGHTAMSDFRHIYHADFDVTGVGDMDESIGFILTAVKPPRASEATSRGERSNEPSMR